MPVDKFSAKVKGFQRKSDALLEAVFKTAVQRTIDIAQEPVAKGGRMRVDTGFLRNSGQASLSGLPAGPSRQDEGIPPRQDVALVIAQLRLGGTLWFGWTARYARPREYRDGFLNFAVMQWRRTVDEVAREARARSR